MNCSRILDEQAIRRVLREMKTNVVMQSECEETVGCH
jgi:hypothetical protein